MANLNPQPNTNNKLVAGGLGGAVAIIVAWLLKEYTNVDMPDYVEMALSTIISLGVAHFTPIRDYQVDDGEG